MHLRMLPLAALLTVWAVSASADATPAESGSHRNGDAPECRLQDNRECLKALEVSAASGPHTRAANRALYAVLVNGDTSDLHNGNVERAYEVLKSLGVPDSNLFILSNSNPRAEAGESQPTLVTARATTANVSNVLAYLSGEVDENDCLLIYTTGHGIRQKGQSALVLNDGVMLEADMVRELKRMGPAVSVLVMDQCFSGGFADAVDRADLEAITITSTDSRHETYCEYFAGAFWQSLIEPEADINGDGRISLNESYEIAMTLHRMALADTPERTHCRYSAHEGQAEPAVSLERQQLVWDETAPARPSDTIVTASVDDDRRVPSQMRRSRLAGHQKGYRPQH